MFEAVDFGRKTRVILSFEEKLSIRRCCVYDEWIWTTLCSLVPFRLFICRQCHGCEGLIYLDQSCQKGLQPWPRGVLPISA